jgi:hypothetical protein
VSKLWEFNAVTGDKLGLGKQRSCEIALSAAGGIEDPTRDDPWRDGV